MVRYQKERAPYWIRYFIRFHGLKHPEHLGPDHVVQFLTWLAVHKNVASSTQNQALNALNFLYSQVICRPLGNVSQAKRARAPTRIPVVFERDEIQKIFNAIHPDYLLPAQLMYGSGLRISECLRLRIKDIDFSRNILVVRSGKGNKDRVTVLPESLHCSIKQRIERVVIYHQADLQVGLGEVWMPDALAKKYPSEAFRLHWQYLFASYKRSVEPRSGKEMRHHMDDSTLQRAVKQAINKAGIQKKGSCHTFCHSFATHLLDDGFSICRERYRPSFHFHDYLGGTTTCTGCNQSNKTAYIVPRKNHELYCSAAHHTVCKYRPVNFYTACLQVVNFFELRAAFDLKPEQAQALPAEGVTSQLQLDGYDWQSV